MSLGASTQEEESVFWSQRTCELGTLEREGRLVGYGSRRRRSQGEEESKMLSTKLSPELPGSHSKKGAR